MWRHLVVPTDTNDDLFKILFDMYRLTLYFSNPKDINTR